MAPTRAEQESVFRWDEAEQVVHVWSASPVTWRKMARLGIHPTRETANEGAPSGKFYAVPLAQFRWGSKRKGVSQGNPEALRRARLLNDQARRALRGAEGDLPESLT